MEILGIQTIEAVKLPGEKVFGDPKGMLRQPLITLSLFQCKTNRNNLSATWIWKLKKDTEVTLRVAKGYLWTGGRLSGGMTDDGQFNPDIGGARIQFTGELIALDLNPVQ